VVGIGQRGKTGDETRGVYDDYEVMEHHRRGGAGASVRPPQEPAPSANAASGRRSRRRSGQRQGAGAQAGPEGQPATGAPAASAPTPGLMGAPVPAPAPAPASAPAPAPAPAPTAGPPSTSGASAEVEQQQAVRPRRRGGKAARGDRGAAPAAAGPGAREAAPAAQPLPPVRPEVSPSPLAGEGERRHPGVRPPLPQPLPRQGGGGPGPAARPLPACRRGRSGPCVECFSPRGRGLGTRGEHRRPGVCERVPGAAGLPGAQAAPAPSGRQGCPGRVRSGADDPLMPSWFAGPPPLNPRSRP
jgi:hypothetical protein